jgi:hypothetical protein
VQVGTSSNSTVSSGTDYAFTSSGDEGPRIAAFIDLPSTRRPCDDRNRRLTFRFSRYGVMLNEEQRTSHGIAHSMICLGFAVMSGVFYQVIALLEGSSIYPTRNFAWFCYLLPISNARGSTGGPVISADLPMSP